MICYMFLQGNKVARIERRINISRKLYDVKAHETEHHPHLTFILTGFQNPVKALVAVRLRLLEKTL